ncbi:4-(cytidine 5'-diphospho)-2-C-methyl-D-erythritol kinase [Microvirga tunisiensis]|uniref:4-diphosphocytidyl-2-C-methyl-D-erythritol kinase n=1 Tax=Microvirga tunisiensis TaxID=2108360 RepID=A0A5N7MNE2_9HYPH|nr:4-(cytidine 5'-diphospho)-2-C-methyl-D-erythritol kinase [Microvirga tunisiensis]MPR10220.1 4-(cytidine 5'-diphospho)-2-C-methyl-D-erythritol kinase [Microvirga tunisiensis]MPR28423.1 4-(cytidine 5'-diphospho)-2-C-methyl-D-erythritol kinase [Microvirga tunisiensis]
MPPPLATRAPAKINLTLHVLGRRADGYHELESLVAFAGTGDDLRLEPGPRLALRASGPTAALAGSDVDNLVLKAARLLADRVDGLQIGIFHLTKRLPVAAGIGGGSSDAAAALRLLARLNELPLSHPALREAARLTGADVPVCLEPRARMMRGAGEALGAPLNLPRLFAVLVNPRVPVETPAVFKALGLRPGQALAGAEHQSVERSALIDTLNAARNDLESPALRIQPLIGEALGLLRQTRGCRLARMSGSGATVFGLYDDCEAAAAAAKAVRRARPDWWVKATSLR